MTITDDLLSRIEDASLNASAPSQQRWLDGWIVRYSLGKARRARCVNAVAVGRLPVAQKLQQVRALFKAADVPLVVRITKFTQPPSLDDELAALGYAKLDATLVLVKPNLRASEPVPVARLPKGMHWQALDADAFAQAVGALRGSPMAHRSSHAARLKSSPVPVRGFAICRDDNGQALVCGQYTSEADMVGLYDIFTHPEVRGQGLASALCERMLSLSVNDGGTTGYLQVESTKTPALQVYRRLGFVDGYTYHYREPADA
jgi:ribosomal protein S18 acetylase RimI-like enzyme